MIRSKIGHIKPRTTVVERVCDQKKIALEYWPRSLFFIEFAHRSRQGRFWDTFVSFGVNTSSEKWFRKNELWHPEQSNQNILAFRKYILPRNKLRFRDTTAWPPAWAKACIKFLFLRLCLFKIFEQNNFIANFQVKRAPNCTHSFRRQKTNFLSRVYVFQGDPWCDPSNQFNIPVHFGSQIFVCQTWPCLMTPLFLFQIN